MNVIIAGCGALGSHIAMGICFHPEISGFHLIDDDRIGQENIGTSAYWQSQIGTPKAIALAEMLYWKSGKHVYANANRLRDRLDGASGLIVDCFDNTEARELVYGLETHTLHSGVSEVRIGVSLWDENYPRPKPSFSRENPICTNQLGARIIGLTSSLSIASILHWLETGVKLNYIVTEMGEVHHV